MALKGLNWLVSVNDFFERVPANVVNFFENLGKSLDKKPQAYVDQCCIWMATKVNRTIERARQRVIRSLYDQYMSNSILGKLAGSVLNFMKDPIGSTGSFIGSFFEPLKVVYEWPIEFAKEIVRLAKNLKDIAEIPNKITPPNPNINFDAFSTSLHVQAISVAEVLAGPTAFIPPETLYPDVPSPFDISSFKKKFDDAPEKKKEDSIVYKLKKKKEDETLEWYKAVSSGEFELDIIENKGNLTPNDYLFGSDSDTEDELKGYFN